MVSGLDKMMILGERTPSLKIREAPTHLFAMIANPSRDNDRGYREEESCMDGTYLSEALPVILGVRAWRQVLDGLFAV